MFTFFNCLFTFSRIRLSVQWKRHYWRLCTEIWRWWGSYWQVPNDKFNRQWQPISKWKLEQLEKKWMEAEKYETSNFEAIFSLRLETRISLEWNFPQLILWKTELHTKYGNCGKLTCKIVKNVETIIPQYLLLKTWKTGFHRICGKLFPVEF